jgi:hypothetical protein
MKTVTLEKRETMRMKKQTQARNRAIVAVARKRAVLLHRIWITQEQYVPFYAVAACAKKMLFFCSEQPVFR